MTFTRPTLTTLIGCLLVLPAAGCGGMVNHRLLTETGGSAALAGQFRAFDGKTGQSLTFADIAARVRTADIVLFGEEHSNAVCNALEAQVLAAMDASGRPVTLAMEFFEADTQAALDAYLTGKIDESSFRTMARQRRAYVNSHRAMIEYCRAESIPVIAANAPSRLTRALRLSGLPFEEFVATLEPADRAWLPRSSETLEGRYHERFVEAMGDHVTAATPTTQPASEPSTQPAAPDPLVSSYRSQSLWDDAMAESIANHRDRHPDRRIMLVVGVFHVEQEGGTLVKTRRRRPGDKILTLVYRGTTVAPLAGDESDRGVGDIVIYGMTPEPPEEPKSHGPTSAPATTMPADEPATTQPSHS